VAGLSLGNEMILSHRAGAAALAAALAALHAQRPGLPLSTTEPFHIFEAAPGAALLPQLDFLLVNVHPVFQPWFATATDTTAAQFVVNVADQLAQQYCGPILIKETGVPTAPATNGYSEARQASFYKELRTRLAGPARAFAYFAAFDAPWRAQDATGVPGPHPEEAYWGLYDSSRRGKLAVDQLPPLAQDPASRNSH
jgi:exo-beta-1,3-glucanase (GH17 family)